MLFRSGGRHVKFSSPAQQQWLQAMAGRGWTVPTWPVAYGGAALSSLQAKVLGQEMQALNCRAPLQSFGIWMLGPALLKFGSEAQKLEHLPPIARGEIRWCQGYSEPNAGSDLASLERSGVRAVAARVLPCGPQRACASCCRVASRCHPRMRLHRFRVRIPTATKYCRIPDLGLR